LSDDFSNISERNSLFNNPVKPSPRSSLFKCKPKKMSSIQSVHSVPAIDSVAYIRRNNFSRAIVHESRNEVMIAVTVDGW